MKRRYSWTISWTIAWTIATVFIATGLAFAQPGGNSAPNASPDVLTFETGKLASGVYSNECFGFSLPTPAGWEVNATVTPDGKARRRSDKSFVLLFLHQQGNLPGRIILSAWDSTGRAGNARDFVSDAVRAQINSPTEKREMVRETFAVDYGGRHFFRSDYKTLASNGPSLYLAYIYTGFRGYFIGETLAAASPEGLDEAADSLRAISFQQDQINPKCVVGPDDGAGSAPGSNPSVPDRVRVSSGVAVGLLIKKVTPEYPSSALQSRVQGQVVLRALIDKNGDVEELTLVSGDPLLAPAALAAVKQWKYKPYLMSGQPVKVETQVQVNFTLSKF